MKEFGELMKRLQKIMPANVKPAFTTGEELLAWQKEQGEIRAAALARENRAMKMQRTFNRSGIRPLHQNCSFDNYNVESQGAAKSPATGAPVRRRVRRQHRQLYFQRQAGHR